MSDYMLKPQYSFNPVQKAYLKPNEVELAPGRSSNNLADNPAELVKQSVNKSTEDQTIISSGLKKNENITGIEIQDLNKAQQIQEASKAYNQVKIAKENFLNLE